MLICLSLSQSHTAAAAGQDQVNFSAEVGDVSVGLSFQCSIPRAPTALLGEIMGEITIL